MNSASPNHSRLEIERPQLFLINRRNIIKAGAASAAALAGLGYAPRLLRADTVTPCATQGPFWVDEQLLRQDVRTDPANNNAVQSGLPLRLNINVSTLNASGTPSPLQNAWVDIWHANGAGSYSDVSGSGNPNNVGQKWLRGYQITDGHGNVRFITVYPGWYIGRAVHIHVRIRTFSGTTATTNFTTQFFFNETTNAAVFARLASIYNHSGTRTLNSTDGIYNSVGSQMLLRMADDNSHAVASFNIKIAANTISTCRAYAHDFTELACEDDHAHDFGGGTPTLALRQMLEC